MKRNAHTIDVTNNNKLRSTKDNLFRSKEEFIMSNSTNRAAVPEAKGALDRFKYEVASEIGVPLTDGYNGDLTSKQNGSLSLIHI